MRVLYLIDNLGPGGAQRQVVELAARLAAREDHRISVATYRPQSFFADRLAEAGVPVHLVEKRHMVSPTLPLRFARLLRAERPDLVHAFMAVPAFWAVASRRLLPAASRPRLLASERAGRIDVGRVVPHLERIAYRGADAVTVNSAPLRKELARTFGVPAERVHYLPNGIDLAAWDAARREPCPVELEPGCFHAALVGRLEPQKNHATLLRALERIPAASRAGLRVWLVGGATGSAAFATELRARAEAAGLGETVRFVEPQRAIAAFLDRIDALLLPSLYEGFPNVLLEAMACGVPSIAAPVGNVPHMLRHEESGLLVPPEDADSLAGALLSLAARSPEERRAMGARGRAVVEERYRIETVTDAYADLYASLCDGARA